MAQLFAFSWRRGILLGDSEEDLDNANFWMGHSRVFGLLFNDGQCEACEISKAEAKDLQLGVHGVFAERWHGTFVRAHESQRIYRHLRHEKAMQGHGHLHDHQRARCM